MSGRDSRSRFPDDHAVEMVRGMCRPSTGKILKELSVRAAWLSQKLEKLNQLYGPQGADKSPHLRELVALVRAADLIEKMREENSKSRSTEVPE